MKPIDELQRELAEETALADAGEANAVFLHELGNLLNNILLQSKLLQQEAPTPMQERLQETCKQIMLTAQTMKQLAQFRQSRRVKPYDVDVNAAARAVAAHWNVQTDLADALPALKTTSADFKRLLNMLIKNALPANAQGAALLSTRQEGEQICLRVESGIQVSKEDLPHLFEPFRTFGRHPDNLELSICKELARRSRGQLSAEQTDKGLTYVATWTI